VFDINEDQITLEGLVIKGANHGVCISSNSKKNIIKNCVLTNNIAKKGDGGAIRNEGELIIK
jgi:hypothetical protein